MKNLIILLIVLMSISCQNNRRNNGMILANLEQIADKFDAAVIFMEKAEQLGDSIETRDTVNAKNGVFKYEFKIKQPKNTYIKLLKNQKEIGTLSFNVKLYGKDANLANPLIGNEKIKIYLNDKNIPDNGLVNMIKAEIEGDYENYIYNNNYRKSSISVENIKNHSSNYALLYRLYDFKEYYTLQELTNLSSHFSRELSNSPIHKILIHYIKTENDLAESGYAFHFNWVDLNGNQYNFEQVKNGKKLVLLIFWASWCKPCRQEIPNLKAFYQNYNQKVSMVSLSIDRDYNRWEQAVKDENMPWLNLSGLPQNDHAIVSQYNILSVPTLILLNEKGEVIKRISNDLPQIVEIVKNY